MEGKKTDTAPFTLRIPPESWEKWFLPPRGGLGAKGKCERAAERGTAGGRGAGARGAAGGGLQGAPEAMGTGAEGQVQVFTQDVQQMLELHP